MELHACLATHGPVDYGIIKEVLMRKKQAILIRSCWPIGRKKKNRQDTELFWGALGALIATELLSSNRHVLGKIVRV